MIVTALADDGIDGATARHRLAGEVLLAPEIIDLEVLSAWRGLVAAGHLSEGRAQQAIVDLRDLRLTRSTHGPLLERCWSLRHNLTVYDAAYVALAERAESTLVTADARLAAAPGPRCLIEVLTAAEAD